jgi:hypothetical protein
MRRRQLLIAGFVLFVVAVVGARSSVAIPNVPPGVEPEKWRPLSSDIGIAIQDMGPGYHARMVGTLMVRDAGRWRSIELVPGSPGAVPAR